MEVYINDVQNVHSYQEAIKKAGEALVSSNAVTSKFSQACIDREADFPTGLLLPSGRGVAIPHGDSSLVKKSSISILRLDNMVDFGLMEDNSKTVSVNLLFNLALESGGEHINILRKIMSLFQDESFLDEFTLTDLKNAKKIFEERLSI